MYKYQYQGGDRLIDSFSPGIKSPANKISDFGTPCFQCSQSPCKHLQSEIFMTISAQFNFNSVKESTVGVRSPVSSLQCPINTSGAAGFCVECLLVQRETKPNQHKTQSAKQEARRRVVKMSSPNVQTFASQSQRHFEPLNLNSFKVKCPNTRNLTIHILYSLASE